MAILGIPITVLFQFILMIPAIVYSCSKAVIIYLLVPQKFRFKKDIKGQTVLITGAGSGLGRQLAIDFSKHSTRLVLLDLNLNSLLETQKLLPATTTSYLYECDVSNRLKVYEVADIIKKDVGKVDILVNNAGIVSGKRLLDIPDEKIQMTMDVNATAHFWTIKAFLPAMIETNQGHIVSIASLAGKGGIGFLTDYCASKHAAVGLMDALYLELEQREITGVKLTTMCPTLMTTGLFEGMRPPLKVSFTPEYVSEQTIYAILEEKDSVLLPGFMLFPFIFRLIFPVELMKDLVRRCGLLYVMDEFKGRVGTVQNGANGRENLED